MKRFIKHLLIYLSALLLSVLLIEMLPLREDSYVKEQIIKDKVLSDPDRDNLVVLCGGSSVAFGFDSDTLSALMGRSVYNDGLHAGFGLKFIMDNCARYLKKGDILILSPEYSHFAKKSAYGGLPLADLVLTSPRQYLSLLDSRQRENVAKNVPMHLKSKILAGVSNLLNLNLDDPVYSTRSFNSSGDNIANVAGRNAKPLSPNPMSQGGKENVDFELYFFSILEKLEAEGIKVLMFPPPITKLFYQRNRDWFLRVSDILADNGFPFMCPVEDCIYDDELFFDSHYHLNRKGAVINSTRLYTLLSTLPDSDR